MSKRNQSTMTILYKYYSSSLELDKYLLNPTIKLSQTSGLNDPFEGKITNSIIKTITNKMALYEGLTSSGSERQDNVNMRRVINEVMDSFGIVSLSETQRNLLMWAHYASEHRGCCIGYANEMLSSHRDKINEDEECYSYFPTKVNYDSVLFDEEQHDVLRKAEYFNESSLNRLIKRAVTTKSNDWIYEKEHRMVIPVEWCDKIIIKPINSLPNYVKAPFDEMGPNKGYKVDIVEQTATITRIAGVKASLWDEDVGQSYENKLSPYKETMFLKNIEKKMIKSIYLGAKYPKSKEQSLIRILSNKENALDHIQVYRYYLSPERFELSSIDVPY